MAAQREDRGLIVAADVRPARVRLLQETVRASGTQSVRLVQADLERPLPFGPVFDVVFVDAPCSGLGTIRRDPDIRWKRREADLGKLAAAQVNMLIHASGVVGRGGRLIYATCSSEPEENDEVVAEFLRVCPSFAGVNLTQQPALAHPALKTVLDEAGRLRTLPPVHQLEAFFGAVLRREG
jgi:16S rRNA (cytosine967-C5)-methyltransferase